MRSPKQRLLTPGPTEVPEPALLAMARQVTHHRTPEFRGLLAEVFAGLKHVFATEHECARAGQFRHGGHGSGGGESGAARRKSHRVGVGQVCRAVAQDRRGLRHRRGAIRGPLGSGVRGPGSRPAAPEHPDAVAVFSTLLETSTGVGHDIEAIGRVVGPSKALLVVNGISGVGAMPCRTDAWGIDVLVVGAQKALMTPPGLAFLAVSPAAWTQIEAIRRPAFYFDLLAYRKALKESDTPYTPAIPLVKALAESLRAIQAAGIEQTWARARLLARATRAGIAALGLRLVAARPADGMTAVYFPERLDGKLFLSRLQTRFGVKLAGGQGPLKGRIFRIAHMGLVDELDILATLAALELVLAEMGQDVKLGTGVAAASRVLAEAEKDF